MPIAKYDIFFSGAIMQGRDEAEVRHRIRAMFKADAAQMERLFSGDPIKIKSEVDMDTAIKYRLSFREAGALIDIKPAQAKPKAEQAPSTASEPPQAPSTEQTEDTPRAVVQSAPSSAEALSALPPNTGSLIDCAREITPAPLPDISGLDLSETGIVLDESEATPELEIDTSSLSASAAGTGTLEDCQLTKQPVEIPDISNLTAAEPGTGSLEDCHQEKEPVEIPDISALEILEPDQNQS